MDESKSSDPLERAAAHAGLGLPLPRKVRFRFLKLIVARMTWLTNRHQSAYNESVIEAIDHLRRDLDNRFAILTGQVATLAAKSASELPARDVALTTAYATDLAALEAALRSELAATLMRAARHDGEVTSAAAVAATATAATLDLRRDVDARFNELAQSFDRLEAAQARAEARARGTEAGSLAVVRPTPSEGETLGGLDVAHFAERFRGSPEVIAARQSELIDYVVDTSGRIVDLGSGRGEWLRLLRDKGLTAIGVDDDAVSVQILRDSGLDVVHADALTYLHGAADASIAVISALHVLEHMPFPAMVALLREALRVLVPGGQILIETPNITNVHMGAANFHLDPGHVQPLHPLLLEFVLQEVGFTQVEVQFLHPRPTLEVPPAASPQLALVIESLNQAFNVGQDVLATAVRPQHG